MVGVAPTFYRIPELVQHVQAGTHPLEKTTVQRSIPLVPNPLSYLDEGLVPLANPVTVMQCFETFKAFVVSLFTVCSFTCCNQHVVQGA